jgi:uncharacterized membrane protein
VFAPPGLSRYNGEKGKFYQEIIMITNRLSPIALGLALGIIWGLSVLIMGLISTYYPYGKAFVASLGTVYTGFAPTVRGSIIGGLIGFVDAFILGLILAWLYNLFAYCCGHHKNNLEGLNINLNIKKSAKEIEKAIEDIKS